MAHMTDEVLYLKRLQTRVLRPNACHIMLRDQVLANNLSW